MDYRFFLMKIADISNQLDRTEGNLHKYFAMSWENRKRIKKLFKDINNKMLEITKIIGENA